MANLTNPTPTPYAPLSEQQYEALVSFIKNYDLEQMHEDFFSLLWCINDKRIEIPSSFFSNISHCNNLIKAFKDA
jgi:hypothetical protein